MIKNPKKAKLYKPVELEEMLQKALNKREAKLKKVIEEERMIRDIRKEQQSRLFKRQVNKMVSIPLIIGIIAAVMMWYKFGWVELEKSLLSWIIGLTILGTFIALLEKYTRF